MNYNRFQINVLNCFKKQRGTQLIRKLRFTKIVIKSIRFKSFYKATKTNKESESYYNCFKSNAFYNCFISATRNLLENQDKL